jgi:hypothetical protein
MVLHTTSLPVSVGEPVADRPRQVTRVMRFVTL